MGVIFEQAAIAGTAFTIRKGLVADLKSGDMYVIGEDTIFSYELFCDPAVYQAIKLSPDQENIGIDVEMKLKGDETSVRNMRRCIIVGMDEEDALTRPAVRLFVLSRFNPAIYLRAVRMLIRFLDEELSKDSKAHRKFLEFIKDIAYRYASELYVEDMAELLYVYEKLGISYFEKEYGLYLIRKEVRPVARNEEKYGFTKEEIEAVEADFGEDWIGQEAGISEALAYYADLPEGIAFEDEDMDARATAYLRERMERLSVNMFADGVSAAFCRNEEDYEAIRDVAKEHGLKFYLRKEHCLENPYLYVDRNDTVRAEKCLEDTHCDSVVKIY